MGHAVAVISTLGRWEVLVGLIGGVLAILGMVWRTGRRLTKSLLSLVNTITKDSESTRANTQAISELTAQLTTVTSQFHDLAERLERVEKAMEERTHRRQ